MPQDLKNAKNTSKKVAKSLEKELEKLKELESTPGKLTKEVQGLEKKLVILEVSGWMVAKCDVSDVYVLCCCFSSYV